MHPMQRLSQFTFLALCWLSRNDKLVHLEESRVLAPTTSKWPLPLLRNGHSHLTSITALQSLICRTLLHQTGNMLVFYRECWLYFCEWLHSTQSLVRSCCILSHVSKSTASLAYLVYYVRTCIYVYVLFDGWMIACSSGSPLAYAPFRIVCFTILAILWYVS